VLTDNAVVLDSERFYDIQGRWIVIAPRRMMPSPSWGVVWSATPKNRLTPRRITPTMVKLCSELLQSESERFTVILIDPNHIIRRYIGTAIDEAKTTDVTMNNPLGPCEEDVA
jgi:hypothetical protein